MELKGEGGGSLLHQQPDPLQWGEGARPGRGRGAPGAGLEALAEVLPGGGNRDGRRRFWRFLGRGCGWLRAPHTPGKGEAGGSGGLRPRPPAGSPRARPLSRRSLAGSAAGRGWELGKGDPEPAVRGRSGLQLVPLCHRLPRAGDHVLPVLHLTGTALPGQVNLRETHPWSHRGRSIPVPLPGTGAFTPKLLQPRFSGLGTEPGYFYPSIFPYGTAEKRVCQLSLLLLPPRGAGATAPAPRIIAGEPGWSTAANYAIKSD